MISVGRRDARKELGLGFGGGERAMEDTELEEGEAWSYHNNTNNDDFDASIDPDIDLSYIDEKLQNVLGHFQKDFEGGVSAENLGAKFGGYGSFLPTYQRSPVWSQPKTPPKTVHGNASRSPNSLQLEGGRHSSVSSSNAPQSVRLEPATSSAVPSGLPKASSSLIESAKQEMHMPPVHFAEAESVNKKSANLSDQKLLKVRIKVGSDNLSTRKNAAIYSEIGLDASPTSSLDDSPSESEGMSHEPQDALFESPFHIIQIMTSFPVRGALLLSPLPDDLIYLKEKEKFPKETGYLPRASQESSDIVAIRPDSVKRDRKMLGEKKVKSLARNENSAESKYENKKHFRSGINGILTKEMELDTSACEELVSNTLKLPLLSSSELALGDAIKGLGKPSTMHKTEVQDKGSSGLLKEEPLLPMLTPENGWVDDSKSSDAAKLSEDKKATALDSDGLFSRKDSHHEGEKPHDSLKLDFNVSKGRKSLNDGSSDPSKQIADKRAASSEQESVKLPSVKVRSSEGKKKSKGGQSHGNAAVDASKDSSRVGTPSLPKGKKNIGRDGSINKGESEEFKLKSAGDRYKDFFGDIETEQEEIRMSPSERSHEHGLKDSDMVQRSTHPMIIESRERSASRKADKLMPPEAFPGASSVSSQRPSDGTLSANAGAAPAPAMEEDNWVCCDKCQTWRLLPPGKNPNDLPEKWVCSMLNWLPGMNRCGFSEEETTLGTRMHFFSNPTVVMPEGTFSGIQRHDQSLQNIASHSLLACGKKKPCSKEFTNLPHKDGATQLSNSVKKSISNGILNNPESDSLKLSKSIDPSLEKHKHKIKEKRKVLDNNSEGGVSKRSKLKGKMDSDQDYSRAMKKIKTEGLKEDWMSDHGGATGKVDPSTSNVFPKLSSGKARSDYNARTSSKDSLCDITDRGQIAAKRPKNELQIPLDNGSIDMGKGNDTVRDAPRKRKASDSSDALIYSGSALIAGYHLQDGKSEFREGDYRKDKKPKVSRSEGKEGSGSKGHGRTDRKGSHRKNQQPGKDPGSTLSQRSLEGTDSLKRDSGSMHPSAAATSSSSKVSGSHKTKSNLHDVKGSPVESVSSSPMRVLKPDKLTSARKNATQKDDSIDAGVFKAGSLRRLSDHEDDRGSDRSGMARREKALDVTHHGSLESSVLDFQENELNLVSGGKAKVQIVPSSDNANRHMNGAAEFLDQDASYPDKMAASDRCHGDGGPNGCHHQMNGSRPKKYGKGSSSRSKDKNRTSVSVVDNDKVVVADSFNGQGPLYEVRPPDGKHKNEEFRVKTEQNENRYVDQRDNEVQVGANSRREGQPNTDEHTGPDVKVSATCDPEMTFTPKQNMLLDGEMDSGRRKLLSTPPTLGAQNETLPHSHKVSEVNNDVPANSSNGVNEPKPSKPIRKIDHADGVNQTNSSSKTSLSNGHRARDLDAPSPVKRDTSSQAATNALKEAKNLKHLADRLKNNGSNLESTRLYFEAALKFLHGASLLETSSSDNARTGEMIQSMQVYSSTAKLCEFCAHEYEKSKDMAAAALAYKCMEVAYMRVIYSSHSSANRDRHELQMALQMVPPGESPSSSASDIDNLNHPTTADKVPLPKGVSSPQVTGTHMIAARNRPNFVRLLNFAQDVNFAMEASRKSRNAFAAANASLGESRSGEGISSIKTALDFNFQDVDGLLRLVRLAIEAISR
ncbi:hypothetical protein Tsubulata_012463 [Turnera subulata]|uniref:CW-type domain-containing protein n=1 Tax=Turnera subulata TaxID=218843 RepID=A0A9Q0FBI2_9ROSI|nr:hypothetical protein Tsubulata_012463 [Turnera subulata]